MFTTIVSVRESRGGIRPGRRAGDVFVDADTRRAAVGGGHGHSDARSLHRLPLLLRPLLRNPQVGRRR